MFDALKFLFEGVIGVDGEIGGDDGKFRADLALPLQEIGDCSPRVVVAQAGIIGRRGHQFLKDGGGKTPRAKR